MLHKFLLASVATLGLALPFTATPTAKAQFGPRDYGPPPGQYDRGRYDRGRYDRGRHECYEVVYRECSHDRWRVYDRFESHSRAHYVADRLERRGFQARVVHHH